MKTKSFHLVAFMALISMTTLFAQQDYQYGHYMFNGVMATASSDNNSSPQSFKAILTLNAGERQSSDHVTPIDALIIINHINGEIKSLEGTLEGRKVEFKEAKRQPRGTHYAFVRFEANGGEVTVSFKDIDNDGAAQAGRQKNRRVEMTIEFE